MRDGTNRDGTNRTWRPALAGLEPDRDEHAQTQTPRSADAAGWRGRHRDLTAALRLWLHLANPTIASLSYLLVVLIAATVSTLRVAIAVSVAADLFLNYFFLPPLGMFVVADPENWVALFAFLAVSVIASDLSAAARERAHDALTRRDELARLLEERKAAELARQSAEFKSALLASLAHDLRTPLTAIRVAAGNLQTSWLPDGDRREQSEVILTEVARLNRLFQNILEMARIDAGAVAAEARWVHPAEIVEAALDQVERRGRRFDIAIESDTLVNLDPRLTAAALAQILQNAAQYTPAGAAITVTVSVSADGLVVTVRDRGPGIAPGDLPHLFDRFYRGREGGTARVGHRHGSVDRARNAAGRTWADLGRKLSGRRSAFTIAVPAESQPSVPADQHRMTNAARILLVDDEIAIQRTTGPLLRSRGYDVEVVGTGADALTAVQLRAPDLIVLDLGLPDIDGTEVCRRIRAQSAAPIIILSARGAEADKVAALDLGADDYVTKPFGPEELLARIRVALRRVFSTAETPSRPPPGRRHDDRLQSASRLPQSGGDSPDAERIRPAGPAGAPRRPRADASRDSESGLGTERRQSAGASVGADGAASPEARTRPRTATLPAQRAVGRLPPRDRRGRSVIRSSARDAPAARAALRIYAAERKTTRHTDIDAAL